jgi:PDZ domain-containing secreted protein
MENSQQQDEIKMAKKKLTREELLAGKCSPEDEAQPNDPRFKSPDEILLQMVSQRKPGSEVTIQHGYRRGETTLGPDSSHKNPTNRPPRN